MASSAALNWPAGLERTDPGDRESGGKFSKNFRKTESDIRQCFERMDVSDWRLDHVTGSGGDPGVVVRWTHNGQDRAVACDGYQSKSANLREAYLWLEETRKRSGRLVTTGSDEFAAAALPGATAAAAEPAEPPHEILGLPPNAPEKAVRAMYEERVKEAHGDTSGSSEYSVDEIQYARDQILGE